MRTGAAAGLGGVALLAFASLGLPDGVLGVAWPSMRRSFGLPVSALGGLLLAGAAGYLGSSFASGTLVGRLGVGRLLVASSAATAASALAMAAAPSSGLAVAAALVGGVGGGAIDAGINAFAAARFTAGLTSWLHASYGIGATLGPLLTSAVVDATGSWRLAYVLIGLVLLGLLGAFAATAGRWEAAGRAGARAAASAPLADVLRRPAVWAGGAAFFLYAGLEVGAGQWAYTWLVEGRGVAPAMAGPWVAAFWGSLTAGRIVAGGLARRVAPPALLRAAVIGVAPGVLVLWAALGPVRGAGGLVLLGLALAPIFPLLVSVTPERVGARHAAHAVGVQIAAFYVGSATLPGAAGLLVRHAGLEALGPFLLAVALALVTTQLGGAPGRRA